MPKYTLFAIRDGRVLVEPLGTFDSYKVARWWFRKHRKDTFKNWRVYLNHTETWRVLASAQGNSTY